MFLLFLWMVVPLAMTLWFSVERYNLLSPGKAAFAGLENYRYLLTGRALWVAMGNTLLLVGLVLLITLVAGTLLAVLLDREFPGRKICRFLVIAPFFVMPTVSALIWKNMLMNPVFGMFAWITRSLGLGAVDFFASMPLLAIAVIVGLGMDALCRADSAAGSAVAEPGAEGGRPAGRGRGGGALLSHRTAAPAASHGGRGDDRDDFLSQPVRRNLRDHGRRSGAGFDQPGLSDFPRRPARTGTWAEASAGGVIAIVLANIVALFLMRLAGVTWRSSDEEHVAGAAGADLGRLDRRRWRSSSRFSGCS